MEGRLIGEENVLEKVLVKFRFALLTVVVAVFQLFRVVIAHTETMLPDITDLAHYHELSCIGIIVAIA